VAQFINHHSFLLFAVPAVLALLYFLLRGPGSLLKQILALLLLAAVVVGFFLARPGGHVSSGAEAEALLLNPDRPTLVEIYSPY
jgi:4-hydroxybenzoate polyprenyltransferase